MPGRVSIYQHSDMTSKGKGACAVRIRTTTDFAANTDAVDAFGRRVAMMGYGVSGTTWAELSALVPDLETERVALERELRETVTVDGMMILTI